MTLKKKALKKIILIGIGVGIEKKKQIFPKIRKRLFLCQITKI